MFKTRNSQPSVAHNVVLPNYIAVRIPTDGTFWIFFSATNWHTKAPAQSGGFFFVCIKAGMDTPVCPVHYWAEADRPGKGDTQGALWEAPLEQDSLGPDRAAEPGPLAQGKTAGTGHQAQENIVAASLPWAGYHNRGRAWEQEVPWAAD